MKKVMVFAVAAATFALISCNKNDEAPSTPSGPWGAGYIPAYPGNYWVYEHIRIDTLGNETPQNTYDSIAVTGKAVIGGREYIVFKGTWRSAPELMDTVMLLRDSAGCYVDPAGEIHFSYSNFTDTLLAFNAVQNPAGDTMYTLWRRMEPEPQWVTVAAGTFQALNFRGTVLTSDPNPGVPAFRYQDKLFARNTGMVLDTYHYLGSPTRFERRLKRYHVSDRSY